jgi:hypothetical protein
MTRNSTVDSLFNLGHLDGEQVDIHQSAYLRLAECKNKDFAINAVTFAIW